MVVNVSLNGRPDIPATLAIGRDPATGIVRWRLTVDGDFQEWRGSTVGIVMRRGTATYIGEAVMTACLIDDAGLHTAELDGVGPLDDDTFEL